jgi:succinyl-CoA synthetase beta subunit
MRLAAAMVRLVTDRNVHTVETNPVILTAAGDALVADALVVLEAR